MNYRFLNKCFLPLLIVIFCFFSLVSHSQKKTIVDSLFIKLGNANNDTNRVNLLSRLAFLYQRINLDTSLIYAEQALSSSKQLSFNKGIADSYQNIGLVKYNMGDYAIAIKNWNLQLKISKELGDKAGIAAYHTNMGIVQKLQGHYNEAIESYLAALKIREEQGDKSGMSVIYNNIGNIHYAQSSYNKALEYFRKALFIFVELDYKIGISACYCNMGSVYKNQGSYDDAIEYYFKSLKIDEETNDKQGLSFNYNNIGLVNKMKGSYEFALKYFIKSLDIKIQQNDKNGVARTYGNIASLNITLADSIASTEKQKLNYLFRAVEYGNKSYNLANEINVIPIENSAANTLMLAHKKLGNHRKAIEFAEIVISTRDSMFNEEKTEAIQEMETKYETEKKQQQIELQETQIEKKDIEIKQQQTFRNALLGGMGAFVIIIVLVVYAYIQKRKSNFKISKQKDIIEKQNENITDSIHYAKRIQTAVLPPFELLAKSLPEHFILFKPRDIVSGDFYWMKKIDKLTIITAVDCTGHGVPGAFMSMLGIAFLNEIVRKKEITKASDVLNELRNQIKTTLRQEGKEGEAKDGMDMALCVVDHENMKLQYSGSYNPLYLIRKNTSEYELFETKADRMPIGIYVKEKDSFTNHEIDLKEKDTFYIFSDGYQDQVGGKDGRKYLTKNFKKLLINIQNKTMIDQKTELNNIIEDWKNYPDEKENIHEQLDDILVIGVRI